MKRMGKILVAGLCLGVPLLLAKIAFQIPDRVFWRYYLVFGGIVIAGAVAVNFLYNGWYMMQVRRAVQLLRDGRAKEYVERLEALHRRARGRFARSMLTINLAAGCIELKQYGRAAELLESVSDVKLSGDLKLVHRLNLCLCYFYQKQTDRAAALYESSRQVFAPYRDRGPYGGNIAVLDIYATVGAKEYARAEGLLKEARSTWTDPAFADDYRYLEEQIHRQRTE